MKKKIVLIALPCLAVLIAAAVLLFLWQTQWKKDPKPEVVDTDTTAFSESFFGTWKTITGKDDHSVSILPSGYAIYKNGTKVDTLRYSSEQADKITVWIDGYIYDFVMENNTLVRYRKGKTDGYTYQKAE